LPRNCGSVIRREATIDIIQLASLSYFYHKYLTTVKKNLQKFSIPPYFQFLMPNDNLPGRI